MSENSAEPSFPAAGCELSSFPRRCKGAKNNQGFGDRGAGSFSHWGSGKAGQAAALRLQTGGESSCFGQVSGKNRSRVISD